MILFSTSVSPLTSCFPPTMAASNLGPYHCLWADDAPIKGIVVTPTSGGIIYAVGLVVIKPKPSLVQWCLHTTCVKVKVFFLVRRITVATRQSNRPSFATMTAHGRQHDERWQWDECRRHGRRGRGSGGRHGGGRCVSCGARQWEGCCTRE